MIRLPAFALACSAMLAISDVAHAQFFFSTGPVLDRMAMATRPSSPGVGEIEAADDFTLLQRTLLTSGSFIVDFPCRRSSGARWSR